MMLVLWTGIVTGFFAAALWALFAWLYRLWTNSRNFGHLKGAYHVRPKFPDQRDRGAGDTVTVTVHRNVLSARFEGLPPGNSLAGEVVMSEAFPRSGRGQYEQTKKEDELQRWGFWQVQVRDDNCMLVHNVYALKNGELVTQGFVWERAQR